MKFSAHPENSPLFLAELKPNVDHYQLEIVDNRYKFISGITSQTVCRPDEEVQTLTDKIDKIVTHKYWGVAYFRPDYAGHVPAYLYDRRRFVR